MKKLILTCALLTSVSVLSFAQSNTTTTTTMGAEKSNAPAAATPATTPQHARATPEQMAERRSQYFQKEYGLNDNQTKGIYQAELEYITKMQEFRANGKQPAPAQSEQMMAEQDEKFKVIMNADQFAKYYATRRHPAPAAAQPAPAPVKN